MSTLHYDQHDANQQDLPSTQSPPGIDTRHLGDLERGPISPTTLAVDSPVSLSRRVSTQSHLAVNRESGAPSLYPYSKDPRLSYIDENFDHYATPSSQSGYFNDKGDANLVDNAAGYSGVPGNGNKYEDFGGCLLN